MKSLLLTCVARDTRIIPCNGHMRVAKEEVVEGITMATFICPECYNLALTQRSVTDKEVSVTPNRQPVFVQYMGKVLVRGGEKYV